MSTVETELLVATRNAKKAAEIAQQLQPYSINVRNLSEFPDLAEVVEDGENFAENAAKKASQNAIATKLWTIGEDSGLCVDVLNGAPGIYSARFSGSNATDAENNAKLVADLQGTPEHKRGAHYVCHVALADPSGVIRLCAERSCHGRIVDIPRGNQGFGYDPHFELREYRKTFAELPPIVKRCLSHRARAFQQFLPQLVKLFEQISCEQASEGDHGGL